LGRAPPHRRLDLVEHIRLESPVIILGPLTEQLVQLGEREVNRGLARHTRTYPAMGLPDGFDRMTAQW